MEFLTESRLVTVLSQVWTRYPFNYDPTTHEVSWSYHKCSDIYHKLYEEQKTELYIEMQTKILNHFFASLDASCNIRYDRSSDRAYVDSYICKLYQTEESSSVREVVSHDRSPRTRARPAPIVPLYKEGVLRNRSDICIAMDHLVCINYIHTHELGPPRYKVCWNWKQIHEKKETSLKKKGSDLIEQIHTHQKTGNWNVYKGLDDSLCILEQY